MLDTERPAKQNDLLMHLHIHHHPDPVIESKLDRIMFMLQKLLTEETKMSAELDSLTAEVQRDKDLQSSAIKLIQGIAAQITAAANDPAAILAIASDLKASDDTLAAAIQANTPPQPAGPVV